MFRIQTSVIALVAAAPLAACSLLPGNGPVTLVGAPWTLAALDGQDAAMPRPATLQFNAETGELTGSTGCNQMRGTYSASAPALDIGRVVTTKMACLGAMDAERAFLDALAATAAFRIDDRQLILLDGADNRLATLNAGAP